VRRNHKKWLITLLVLVGGGAILYGSITNNKKAETTSTVGTQAETEIVHQEEIT